MRITIQRASLTHIDIDLATIYRTALTVFPGSSLAPRVHSSRWVLFLIATAFALGVIVSSSSQILFFLAKVIGIASLTFLVLLALIWAIHLGTPYLYVWWTRLCGNGTSPYTSRPRPFQHACANKHRFLV